MDGHGRTFLLLQVFFCFFVFASTEETKQNCSQVQCPGPLTYYDDVGCTPVYKNEGDCCAYKYNCDHLDGRSPNKCYIKNRSYEIGEYANSEEMDLCVMRCICSAGRNSTGFWCTFRVYIPSSFSSHRCYLKRYVHECGPGTVICAKSESDIPRCAVDGYKLLAGEFFIPKNEPWKWCICQEGYTGDNVEPFCTTMSTKCYPFAYHTEDMINKNAPIYNLYENPATDCLVSWRRQNENDTVTPNPNKSASLGENLSGENENLTCKFGNLTMNIGDQLSPHIYYDSSSVNCTCEVPPTPTCKLSKSILNFW